MKHRNAVLKYAVAAVTLAPAMAFAAVPAEVTGMFDDLQADFGTILGLGFGLLAVVVGGMVLMGWGKKIPKKAAG